MLLLHHQPITVHLSTTPSSASSKSSSPGNNPLFVLKFLILSFSVSFFFFASTFCKTPSSRFPQSPRTPIPAEPRLVSLPCTPRSTSADATLRTRLASARHVHSARLPNLTREPLLTISNSSSFFSLTAASLRNHLTTLQQPSTIFFHNRRP